MYTIVESNILYYTECIYYLCFWCFYYSTLGEKSNYLSNFLIHLPESKMIEGKSRVVASIHAFILSFFSVLYLNGIIDYRYWISFLPICSSFGIFDLTLVTINYDIFKKGYIPILIHHGLLIFGPLLVSPENSHLMAQAFLFEVTVPVLDFNWYLYHTNQKDTMMFKINCLLSVISFLFFRVANNCYLLARSFKYNFKFQFVTLLFLCLNIHWFLKIVKLFISQ